MEKTIVLSVKYIISKLKFFNKKLILINNLYLMENLNIHR